MVRSSQVAKFQTDPTYKVLLLSLRTDNSGLTLVAGMSVRRCAG